METQEQEAINKGMLTLWVIWAAMLGSLLIYIFVCHQLSAGVKSSVGDDSFIKTFKSILYVIVVAELFIIYYLRKLMLKVRISGAKASYSQTKNVVGQPPFVMKYTLVVIISLGIAESIGIYGLVLFFLGDGFRTLYTFMVVSALAMLFYRPKREELERLTMAYKKADSSTVGL